MIGYVTIGTNDLPCAAAFYDVLPAQIGAKRLWDTPADGNKLNVFCIG